MLPGIYLYFTGQLKASLSTLEADLDELEQSVRYVSSSNRVYTC